MADAPVAMADARAAAADAPLPADGGTHATKIGSAGGTVTGDGGRVTLVIPAGALDRDLDILITPADVAGAMPGTGYELSPSGILFRAPATLTIAYDPSALPSGTDEASLRVSYDHPDGPRFVGNGSLDTNAHAVSTPIIHSRATG